MKLRIAYLIILISGITLLGFSAYWLGYNDYEPKTITEYVEKPVERIVRVEVPIEVPVEVIRTVYLDREVEKIVEKPIQPKEWQSVEEFLSKMPMLTPMMEDTCLPNAIMIQNSLMARGYPVSIAPSWMGLFYDKRIGGWRSSGHAGIFVVIQGAGYYYEPVTRGMTELWGNSNPKD